jgi:hypothetical protein
MAAAIEHYKLHELADCGDAGKAYSTRQKKTLVLNRWVLPHWGKLDLRAIKTVAVEQWLRTLITTRFGGPKLLAGGTKEKIRDAMSSVFNHAILGSSRTGTPLPARQRVPVSVSRLSVNELLMFWKSTRCSGFWKPWRFEKGQWYSWTWPLAFVAAS